MGRAHAVEPRRLHDRGPPAHGLRRVRRPRGRGVGGGRRVLSAPVGERAADRLFREHFGRAVAALIRAVGDWDLAEEAVQDAFATAVERWPRAGVPRDPLAWSVAVARNPAIDPLPRDRALRARAPDLPAPAAPGAPEAGGGAAGPG